MATPVMMPKVGISVESCILTEWHKKKGDKVNVGDVLFTYETDKSTMDEVSEVEGIILEQFAEEGDDVVVMTNVCVIGNEGESTAEFAPAGTAEEAPAAAPEQPAQEAAPAAPQAAAPVQPQDGFLKISPRAKKLAEAAGMDPRYATPTGAEGRVIERDIRALMENGPSATYAAAGAFEGSAGTGIGGKFSVADIGAAPAAAAVQVTAASEAAYTDEKLSGIRKVIAKNMAHSLATIPQLTHNSSFDATEIMAFRKKIKASAETLGLNNITLNDIILYAVSRILMREEFRALNAHMLEDNVMRVFNGVHLGLAVDTPRGLMVPTIFNADKKSLNEIAGEAKALAAQCQKGNIDPALLSGASFTISNLGSFGIESFTPVINPPQTGILGVDTIMTRVKDVNGQLVGYPAMGLSLTYDHRAIDGAPASKFLAEMKNALENFSTMLCK